MSTLVPAGAHGADARLVARSLGLDPDGVLDLSASCNPFAPDPTPIVAAHLGAGALRRYPDAHDAARATDALAEAIGVSPARLLVTNGGAEAIALVTAELGQGWVDEPDFSLYRRHLGVLSPGAPRYRSDPHNPSGELAGDDESAAVWDEAFYPLATGRWTRSAAPAHSGTGGPPKSRDRPAVVLGSLTKVLGCPGLRLGYVMVPEDADALALRLSARQPAWSVSTPALLALPELLGRGDIATWPSAVASARNDLVTVLQAHRLAPQPSAANFVLVPDAPGLRARLAPVGVVVRDCTSFGLPDAVRIAVPDGDGLARLDAALDRALEPVR